METTTTPEFSIKAAAKADPKIKEWVKRVNNDDDNGAGLAVFEEVRAEIVRMVTTLKVYRNVFASLLVIRDLVADDAAAVKPLRKQRATKAEMAARTATDQSEESDDDTDDDETDETEESAVTETVETPALRVITATTSPKPAKS